GRRGGGRGWSGRPPSARECSCRYRKGHAWVGPSWSPRREAGKPPCCSTTATHVLMHSSQIYTDGPATSRPTWSAVRPQNEQRSLDCRNRALAASFRPMLYIHDILTIRASAKPGRRANPCFAVLSPAKGGHGRVGPFRVAILGAPRDRCPDAFTIERSRSFRPPRP